jgi:hypothetical protein
MKHLQHSDNMYPMRMILNFEIDVRVQINQYYKLNYLIVIKKQLMLFQINLSYVLDDHFVDDVQEQIDLIFQMFVYNKHRSQFDDQLRV